MCQPGGGDVLNNSFVSRVHGGHVQLLYDFVLGDRQRIAGMAHQHPSGVDPDVFVGDGVLKDSAGLDHGALHQHAVGRPWRPSPPRTPAEEDGVFHLALDDAAVGHQGVDRAGASGRSRWRGRSWSLVRTGRSGAKSSVRGPRGPAAPCCGQSSRPRTGGGRT